MLNLLIALAMYGFVTFLVSWLLDDLSLKARIGILIVDFALVVCCVVVSIYERYTTTEFIIPQIYHEGPCVVFKLEKCKNIPFEEDECVTLKVEGKCVESPKWFTIK